MNPMKELNDDAGAEEEEQQQQQRRPEEETVEGEQGWALGFLRALDLQSIGACRADDRLLSPRVFNLTFSSCGATPEHRLIAHLSQHFDIAEIGMLLRCLCLPLVSVRVGKVEKQGRLLCPTSTRGHLNLNLLPSSNMHVSFVGDDGQTEHLAFAMDDPKSSEEIFEEISADASKRSFRLSLGKSKVYYYWCAEKSRQHGMDLLAKMRDLLETRPTLSDLTTISDSRLDAFAAHLHAYFLSSSIGEVKSASPVIEFLGTSNQELQDLSSSNVSKSSNLRPSTAQAPRATPTYHASLSPRSNPFNDGTARTTCIRSVGREKLKRLVDCQLGSSTDSEEPAPSSSASVDSNLGISSDLHHLTDDGTHSSAPLCLPDILTFPSFSSLTGQCPPTDPVAQSSYKPQYCWCPPCPSSLQYNVPSFQLPATPLDPLSFPSWNPLLSAAETPTSWVPSKSEPIDPQHLKFPALLHDPLLRLPLPTSLVSLPSSQVPTFTSMMSDPIVHIPVMDVCSSGQAYLVSAGPAISSSVPLLPGLGNPLIPESESAAERTARETLRRLIASTPPPASCPQLINLMPAVLSDVAENLSRATGNKEEIINATNKLFGTCLRVETILSDISALGLQTWKQESSGGDDHSKMKQHEDEDHSDGNW